MELAFESSVALGKIPGAVVMAKDLSGTSVAAHTCTLLHELLRKSVVTTS
jgi:hypothetical protein